MSIALVTGATGCIGHALVRELLRRGEHDEVRTLVRPGRYGEAPPGARVVTGTLDDADALARATCGASVVFHAAAKVHDAHGTAADFDAVNVAGTGRLLAAWDAVSRGNKGPRRFVFFSTVAVYGETTPPSGLSESALPAPGTPYAASKLAAEKLVAAWSADNIGVSLRVATVYGPRDRGNMARMNKAIARRRFVLPGAGRNRKTCVAVENVVAAALAVAQCPNEPARRAAAGGALVVADARPYVLAEIARAMAQAAGVPIPPAAPTILLLALALGAQTTARLARRGPPLTLAQVRRLAADNVFHAQRLSEITGYDPQTTLSQFLASLPAPNPAVSPRHEAIPQ